MGVVVALCHNCDIPCNIPSSHLLRMSSMCQFHRLHLCIWIMNVKVQLVIIMVERRRDGATEIGPYGLELTLYLNFDPAQARSNVTLLKLKLQAPLLCGPLPRP